MRTLSSSLILILIRGSLKIWDTRELNILFNVPNGVVNILLEKKD